MIPPPPNKLWIWWICSIMFPEPFPFFVFQCDGIDRGWKRNRGCSGNCIFFNIDVPIRLSLPTQNGGALAVFNHLLSVCATAAVPTSISFSLFNMQTIITQRTKCKKGADWVLHSRPEKIPSNSQMCSPVAYVTMEKCRGTTQAADRWLGRKNYHWY